MPTRLENSLPAQIRANGSCVQVTAGVLASPANHQILDLWIGAWPAGRSALFAAIEFLSHQLALPGENGIGFGETRNLLQSFAS